MREKEKNRFLSSIELREDKGNLFELQIGDENFVLEYNPIFIREALDMGTTLLAQVAEIKKGDNVLNIFPGSGILGMVASRLTGKEGRVAFADIDISALDYVRENLGRNHVNNAEILPIEDFASLGDKQYDVVIMNFLVQSKKEVVLRAIKGSARALKPGGKFYLAGARKKGILTFERETRELFGNAEPIVYKQGYRVVMAVCPENLEIQEHSVDEQVKSVNLRGGEYKMIMDQGVFAEGGLDEGTALLIESMAVEHNDIVLDLGCGSGIIGIVAADLASRGKVYLVDSSQLAVNLARRNVELNGIENVEVLQSDALGAVRGIKFDVIVTNPPFHLGREKTTAVAEKFVEEAFLGLKKGGRFYLVANIFLPYEKTIKRYFGNAKAIVETSKYKILMAKR